MLWSADIDSTFSQMGQSYVYMWGPSEFTAVGPLSSFILCIGKLWDEMSSRNARTPGTIGWGLISNLLMVHLCRCRSRTMKNAFRYRELFSSVHPIQIVDSFHSESDSRHESWLHHLPKPKQQEYCQQNHL